VYPQRNEAIYASLQLQELLRRYDGNASLQVRIEFVVIVKPPFFPGIVLTREQQIHILLRGENKGTTHHGGKYNYAFEGHA
jgi:hypothetical protein